jgi:hypothetical protein
MVAAFIELYADRAKLNGSCKGNPDLLDWDFSIWKLR